MGELIGPIFENVIAGLLGSALVFAGGFIVGRYRERRRARGRNLEDYDFYPFAIDQDNFPQFDLAAFRRGVDHLLRHPDATAARQLIFIAEQNEVRHQLGHDALADYERLYARYGGARLIEDNDEFLENYKRIEHPEPGGVLAGGERQASLARLGPPRAPAGVTATGRSRL